MGDLELCAWGMFGALAVRLIGSVRLLPRWEDNARLNQPRIPAYLKSGVYWAFSATYCFFAGAAVLMYLRSTLNPLTPIAAANIGAFWPLLFQTGVQAATKPPIGGKFD